jgi:acetoin utilization deacetylase AcuC-like enzyme
MSKYRLLRERVLLSGLVDSDAFVLPHAASDEELGRAHDLEYITRASQGLLDESDMKRIGFPWSRELIERSRRSSGATIEACRAALQDGLAVNLAGGTHHAFRDHGEGYCLFNDSVVAARTMQVEERVQRVAVIDLDVHQGNGTAKICEQDQSIFTFSMHGEKNYPLRKEKSDLDIELPDGTGDTAYLDQLERGLKITLASRPQLVIYLAGSDPFFDDRLGRLSLTKSGLAERDRLVFEAVRFAGLPMAITMAGGYAKRVEDTVDIHWQTVQRALLAGT